MLCDWPSNSSRPKPSTNWARATGRPCSTCPACGADYEYTTEKRVEILRRKAQVIEEQLKDAPRAFRTHLVALLLAPEDAV